MKINVYQWLIGSQPLGKFRLTWRYYATEAEVRAEEVVTDNMLVIPLAISRKEVENYVLYPSYPGDEYVCQIKHSGGFKGHME